MDHPKGTASRASRKSSWTTTAVSRLAPAMTSVPDHTSSTRSAMAWAAARSSARSRSMCVMWAGAIPLSRETPLSTFRKWEWLEEVKKYDLDAIAEALGLKVVRGHGNALALTPCPCCNAEIRGGKDKTGPVGLRSDREGWRCHRCDKAGDGIGLVVAVVTGNPTLSAGAPDWRDVHNRCAHAGLCDPVPFSGDGPVIPRIAVRPQWPTCVSKIWLDAESSAELVAFWNSTRSRARRYRSVRRPPPSVSRGT